MLARSHHVFYEGLRNNRTKENTCSPSGKGLPKGQIPHAYPLMLSTWHRGAVVQRKAHLRNSQLCWQFFAGNGVRWGFWYVFKTFRGAGQRMWHFSKNFKSQLTLDLNIDSVAPTAVMQLYHLKWVTQEPVKHSKGFVCSISSREDPSQPPCMALLQGNFTFHPEHSSAM